MICLQNPQLEAEDTNTTRNTKKRRQSDINQSCDLEMLQTLPDAAFLHARLETTNLWRHLF